jgi:hypothetical protein
MQPQRLFVPRRGSFPPPAEKIGIRGQYLSEFVADRFKDR